MSAILQQVFPKLCAGMNSPRALTCYLLAKYEEWDQLVTLRAEPSHYLTAYDYYQAVVPTDFLRKCAGLPTSFDTEAAAVSTWWECERINKRSNDRLSPHLHNGPFDLQQMRIHDFLMDAKKEIGLVMGRLPLFLDGRHGPGSTFGDRSWRLTVLDKMSKRPTVALPAECLLYHWGRTAWSRGLTASHVDRSDPERVRGNRFTTVPKDAKTDRPIAIEPSINVFYQLAVGDMLKTRLYHHGIDLREGQERHRQEARDASVHDDMATIDLSSASDLVCYNLVKILLPEDWFTLLDSLRSPFTRINDKWVRLEKFSSMGNGYTFELETLLFLGLAMTTCRKLGVEPIPGHNIFVYGDDIILPKTVSRAFLSVLRYVGAKPNERKTFLSGNFRESCGGDFFRGHAVRPHYLKELPSEPQEYISLANGIRRIGSFFNPVNPLESVVRGAWFACLDQAPADVRKCRGPASLGDLVFHDGREYWSTKTRNSRRYFRVYRPVTRGKQVYRFQPGPLLAAALLHLRGMPDSSGWTAYLGYRNNVRGYKLGWVQLS